MLSANLYDRVKCRETSLCMAVWDHKNDLRELKPCKVILIINREHYDHSKILKNFCENMKNSPKVSYQCIGKLKNIVKTDIR